MQPAGGIQKQYIVAAFARRIECAFGNRIWLLTGDDRQGGNIRTRGHGRQLFLRGWTIDVERGNQRFLALFFRQPFGEFTRGGCFTGTLQPAHQDDGRGRAVQV